MSLTASSIRSLLSFAGMTSPEGAGMTPPVLAGAGLTPPVLAGAGLTYPVL